MKVGTKLIETLPAQKVMELLATHVATDLGLVGKFAASLRTTTTNQGKIESMDVILEYQGETAPSTEPEPAALDPEPIV